MIWITRRHAVEAALHSGTKGVLYVSRQDPRVSGLVDAATKRGLPVRHVDTERLKRLAGQDVRGFAFQMEKPSGEGAATPTVELKEWLTSFRGDFPSPILALDHITDPHNLGAILRSAHWFDVPLVLIPQRRSAGTGDVVARASAGAVSYVPLAPVTNLRQALHLCREAGYWIYAADAGGTSIGKATIPGPTVLVLGGEGTGISRGLEKVIDGVVSIPRTGEGESTVDSLNVSVSAGILLYAYRYGVSRSGEKKGNP